jgi:hypothetical protein
MRLIQTFFIDGLPEGSAEPLPRKYKMNDIKPDFTRYPEQWLAKLQEDPEFDEALERETESHLVRANFGEPAPNPGKIMAAVLADFWALELDLAS